MSDGYKRERERERRCYDLTVSRIATTSLFSYSLAKFSAAEEGDMAKGQSLLESGGFNVNGADFVSVRTTNYKPTS